MGINLIKLIEIASSILVPLVLVVLTIIINAKFNHLKPATKEDAKRESLHQLESFCPPKWGEVSAATAVRDLSRLYKHLQYASRGHSFIVTRAAVWKMKKFIDVHYEDKTQLINIGDAKKLYVWKTLIASAIGNQMRLPANPNKAQRKYKKLLIKSIAHTKWVLHIYNRMHYQDEVYKEFENFYKNELDNFEIELAEIEKNST